MKNRLFEHCSSEQSVTKLLVGQSSLKGISGPKQSPVFESGTCESSWPGLNEGSRVSG